MISAAIHPIASPEDYAECRRVMFGASKNYAFASRLLPRSVLRHVEALYALMRVGDDRVDVTHEGFASPLAAIEDWERAVLAGVRDGSQRPPGDARLPGHRADLRHPGQDHDPVLPRHEGRPDDHPFPDLRRPVVLHGRQRDHRGPRHDLYPAAAAAAHDRGDAALRRKPLYRHAAQQLLARYRAGLGIGRVVRPGGRPGALPGDRRTTSRRAGSRRSFIALLEFEMERAEAYYRHACVGVRHLADRPAGASWPGWRSTAAILRDPPQRLRRLHPPRQYDAGGRSSGWRFGRRRVQQIFDPVIGKKAGFDRYSGR